LFAVLYSPVEAVHIRSDPALLRMKTSKSFTVIRPLPLPSGNGEPLLRPAERLRSVSAHEEADGFCSPTGRYSSEDKAGRHAGDRGALDGAAADRDRGDARCRLAARQAGLSVSCHHLRHTMATHMLNAEAELTTVQDLLGHTWITTTQRYCRLSNQKVKSDYFKAVAVVMQKTTTEPLKP
jgi:hypothetical protein